MPTTLTVTTRRSPQSAPSGAMDATDAGAMDAQATEARTWQDDPETREALIRVAAYSFYERRGFVDGHELEDWLQAEMEIDRRATAGAVPGDSSPAPN